MEVSSLRRSYYFSDTYGNSDTSADPDAVLCTDFRSRPLEHSHQKFDIYQHPRQTDHLLRLVHQLHDEIQAASYLPDKYRREFRKTITGIFINVAARTEQGRNGDPFYRATSKNGQICIVGTPIRAFSPIKSDIESFEVLPNSNNGLYGDQEQFRSSYAPLLLDPQCTIQTEPASKELIPEPDEAWHVAYIDRFQNIVTYAGKNERREIRASIQQIQNTVRLRINGEEQSVPIHIADSLAKAKPGNVSLYENGNFDIVRKWTDRDKSPVSKLDRSAYQQLGKPDIGAKLEIC